MKIIDAHLHFDRNENFNQLAIRVGHENTAEHIREYFKKENIVHAIVMGNSGLREEIYPDFFSYCVGIDREILLSAADALCQLECHLRKKSCVGIKIYAGYSKCYVYDSVYTPVYELAMTYQKPVAIHTGVTAGHAGLLKYSHPLTIDELAVSFPQVSFVICHFGNPWIMDAAAVIDKNENVAMDLSGLLEDRIAVPQFFEQNKEYMNYIKAGLQFISNYDRVLYGTDWPLVNFSEYIAFIEQLIPEKFLEKVFYENACRVYGIQEDVC